MKIISHDSTSPSTKRREICPVNRTNNISKLPDDVLSLILSRLPIKAAVRTCVLSKDWEFKWTIINNLDMNTTEYYILSVMEPKFISIVERVVHHLRDIKNFGLLCFCVGDDKLYRLANLISVICRRNVECLTLRVERQNMNDFVFANQKFVLPRSLLNCTSLKKLYLYFETPCCFKVPVKSEFPNLKSLFLEGVQILNDNSNTDTLAFTFPVLENLEIRQCNWSKVKFVEIYAPLLRTFTSAPPSGFNDKKDYCIKVIGATIHQFFTNCDYPENISMTGSTVACAKLYCTCGDSDISRGLQVRKLLRELSNVRYLSISGALQAIKETKLGLPLPRFTNLSSLSLSRYFDGEGLIELLHAAPFLKCLAITLDRDWFDYDSVENLPSCLEHHLEEVLIDYEHWIKHTHLVEKFLLKNGACLKSFGIGTLADELPDNEILGNLSIFQKASACVHIFAFKYV